MPEDIQLSVGIKTEDIRNKAEALRATVQKMLDASVGTKLDSSLKQILSQMSKVSAESAKLEAQMGNLDRAHLDFLTKELSDLQSRITEIQSSLSSMGTSMQNPQVATRMREELAELQTTYRAFKEEKETVMSQGLGGLGISTEADQATVRLNELNNQLTILKTKFDEASSSGAGVGEGVTGSADRATASVSELGGTISSSFSGLKEGVSDVASAVGGKLVGAFAKAKKAMERTFSAQNLKRSLVTLIKYTIGVRSLYFLFRKLRNAVKEGLQNLVQYQSATNETNKAMTAMNSSLLYLKNAWAAAFAPIINYVMPMLTALIDKMAKVGNAIARFIGALTGQGQVLNAVKVNAGDYANSLNKVGGSAKKARDRLAAFDDLNVLGKDDDGSGGGGGAYTPDPSEMFKYVDAVSELATMIQDAINNGFDFTTLGATIADNLKQSLKEVNSHWGEIQEEAYNIGKAIGTLFNGFFGDTELFSEAGKTIAEFFDTIGQAIRGFLDNYEFGTLGESVSEFFRGAFTNFDWKTAGANLGDAIKLIFTEASSLIRTFPADELIDGVVEFYESIDWAGVFTSIVDFIFTSFSFIGKFAEKLGMTLGSINPDDIIAEFEKIDWSSVAEGVGDLMVGMFTLKFGAVKFIAGMAGAIISGIGTALGEAVYSLAQEAGVDTSTTGKSAWEIGQNIATGILYGIGKVMVGIGQWLYDNVVVPLTSNFRELFGISSPSTLFAEYGVDIMQGLLNGMNSLVDSVIQLFIDLGGSLAQKWDELKLTASEKWRDLKTTITGKVIEIKDSVVGKFTEIKDNIIGKILMLKDNAIQKFMEIKAGIYNAFSSLGEIIKSPINTIIGIVESFVNKIIKGINNLIGSFDGIGDLASQVGLTVPELKIPEISIPRLAQGAVIPPNKEFMAVLGDQSHGTNIEAPLDTIKQAVAEVMGANGNQEVVQLLQQLITVVENKNLTIGDKEIGKANARYTNQQRMIRGTSF